MNHSFVDHGFVGLHRIVLAAVVDKQHLVCNRAKPECLQRLRLPFAVVEVDCSALLTLLTCLVFLGHLFDDLYCRFDWGLGLRRLLLFLNDRLWSYRRKLELVRCHTFQGRGIHNHEPVLRTLHDRILRLRPLAAKPCHLPHHVTLGPIP